MRRLASIALSLVAAFTMLGTVSAQEYAPLIQKDVMSLFRVNVAKIDPAQLGAQTQKIGAAAIDYFAPDLENKDDVKQALPIVNIFISQFYTEYVKPLQDAGVENVYVVVPAAPGETLYPYVAIPIKDLEDGQVEKIRSHMKRVNQKVNEAINYRFSRNGFFFMPIIPDSVDDADAKQYIKDHFSSMKAVDADVFKAGFKAIDADEALISCVALSNKDPQILKDQKEQILKLINDIDDDDDDDADDDEIVVAGKDLVQFTAEFAEKAAKLAEYNAWAVNVDEPSLTSVVGANSNDDAKEYVALVEGELLGKLNNFIDVIEKRTLAELEPDDANDPDDLSADEIKELASSVKELLPNVMKFDRDGSKLTWKLDAKFFDDNETELKDFAKKVTGAFKKLQTAATDEINDELYDDNDDNDDND